MAETLGVITSTIQLVDTALKAREYVKDFVNAPQEQRRLFSEMDTLKPLLGELQKRVLAHPSPNSLQQMKSPLNRFKTTMENFTEKLKPPGGRWHKFSNQLAWTLWNKKEGKEYLEEFERIKLLLNTWLVLDIWYVLMVNLVRDVVQLVSDESPKRDELIEWFSPLNPFLRQTEIFSTRQSGTGKWLLEDVHFKAWKSSRGGIMWCRGIPGAGKTVLASIVVDHLRTQFQPGNIGVACIYLNHKETELQSPSNLIASLWRQLIFNKPLSSKLPALYAQHQEQHTRPSLNEIRSQLYSAVEEHLKVYIVVDALDEYPDDKRSILFQSLAEIQPMVNLLLTARPHISISFPHAEVVEIHATEDDIRCYIENRVQESSRLSKHIAARPEFKDLIEEKVVRNVDGMFLLAKLHMDSLATKNTIRALRDALNSMPRDLHHTYDEAMDRIDRQNEDDRRIGRLVLVWISNAKRPLSIAELQEALAVEPGDTALDGDNILDIDIMLSVCAGLVVIDHAAHIARLVHYTAQQYFDSIQSSRFPDAQVDIAATCLTYLSFETSAIPPPTLWHVSPSPVVNQYSLHSYATEYCLLHTRGRPELPLKSMILAYLDGFPRFYDLIPSPGRRGRELKGLPAPTILIAAAFNLCEITRHLLFEDNSTSTLNQVLCVASHFGAVDTVRLLIDAGADAFGTALNAAAGEGHEEVVRLLIDNGADVNSGYEEPALLWTPFEKRPRSALLAAVNRGSAALVHLLIIHGAKVDANYEGRSAPLDYASFRGHWDVVRTLIDNGDSNLRETGGNALLEACCKGEEDIASLLILNGADVNSRYRMLEGEPLRIDSLRQGDSALQIAAFKGQEAIVELLVKTNGIDLNIDGHPYGTPLQAAAKAGHEKVARILLDNGANVHFVGEIKTSALAIAVKAGHEKVARMLLDNGANVHFAGEIETSALAIALAKGDEKLIKLLVDRGGSAEAQDYHTALDPLLLLEREEMVRFAIENGADVNAPNDEWGTFLQAASAKGTTSIVALLIEKGAEINKQGGYYGSALQAAAKEGRESVVRLLLDNGADINLRGGAYGSALEAASGEGHESIVRLLEAAAEAK
ncbi:ankyrin repeat-containing domain protein [Mycena vulgaris]|nr:ankyrin repeat-containing domain protein [Mycena vulgaris]